VVEHLLCKCETLSSNPSLTKTNKLKPDLLLAEIQALEQPSCNGGNKNKTEQIL
jgi:hypothetical protein